MVQQDDGLPTRIVKHWTEDKLYFWHGYIHITSVAMANNPKWQGGLVYVDLFGGPGVCTLHGESGRRVPGSPLIAACAPKPFRKVIVCEKNRELADACEKRLARTPFSQRCVLLRGDCNEMAGEIAAMIPPASLTIAFIDPTGLHAKFDTIRTITAGKQVDLLVLFADAYDIVRNVEKYYRPDRNSKLDQVLGPDSNWRSAWDALDNQGSNNARCLFAEIYRRQLAKHLGYVSFDEQTMCHARGPLYRLVYASKHEMGLDFWRKATKKYAGGQKRLFD
jgi:three-Cys-motif partner protein